MADEMTLEQALAGLDSTDIEQQLRAIETIGRLKYAPALGKLESLLEVTQNDLANLKSLEVLSEIYLHIHGLQNAIK